MIRYEYLWATEESQGYAQGEKRRPCAVTVTLKATPGKPPRAMVCGITHTEPSRPSEGIEIPLAVKQYLGLDEEPSWVIASEYNLIEWTDPRVHKTPSGAWEYGELPPAFMQQVKALMMVRSKAGTLEAVNRPAIDEIESRKPA